MKREDPRGWPSVGMTLEEKAEWMALRELKKLGITEPASELLAHWVRFYFDFLSLPPLPPVRRPRADNRTDQQPKRGRPSKASQGQASDTRQGWMFARDLAILAAYDAAKHRGRTAAIQVAIKDVKARWPWMRCSETEVKRVLAYWRPGGGRVRLIRAGRDADTDWQGELVCHWDGPSLCFGLGRRASSQPAKRTVPNRMVFSKRYRKT